MEVNLDFIAQSIKGRILSGNRENFVNGVGTDSRNIKKGELFFALKGQVFDGHDFVIEALDKGASAAVVSEMIDCSNCAGADKAIILVDDTLRALQELAAAYRKMFDIPIIAVTGSVGKTTTKDITALCLQSRFKTLKTEENMNNEIGVPLTILKLEENHGAAVIELAMRARGEIKRLAEIVKPSCAVISSVEPVHLETLKTLENIVLSKCEILRELKAGHFAVINGDSELLVNIAAQYPCTKYTFGYREDCDFQILDVSANKWGININSRLIDRYEQFYFPVPSSKLAGNVISAAAVSFLLGVKLDEIRSSLMEYKPSSHRLNIKYLQGGGAVIDDTYNANPVSMAAALETSRELLGGGKLVAVLGDMFELGEYEIPGHLEVGKKAAEVEADVLITVGERAKYIVQGALEAGMPPSQIYYFQSKEECVEFLSGMVKEDDVILFKASRAMEMETLMEELIQRGTLEVRSET